MTENIDLLYSTISSIFSNELIKTFILFLLIPIIMKYYETNYLSDFAQKKNVWLNFIQKNQHIQECFSKYDQIEKEAQPSVLFNYSILLTSVALFLIFLFIAFLTSFLLYGSVIKLLSMILYANIESKAYISLDYFSQTLFSIFFLIIPIILSQQSRKIYEKATNPRDYDILLEYSSIQKRYHVILISSFVFSFFAISLFFQNTSYIFYAVGTALFFIVVYKSIYDKRFYTRRVQNSVNNEFCRNFPYLEISTVGVEKFIGKLADIFDYEAITLSENDVEIKIMWSAVASLKETKSMYQEGQKHLNDFFKGI